MSQEINSFSDLARPASFGRVIRPESNKYNMTNPNKLINPLQANYSLQSGNEEDLLEDYPDLSEEDYEQPNYNLEEADDNDRFEVVFTEGYSFRNLVQYLALVNNSGCFDFYPDHIEYSRSTPDGSIHNEVMIKAHELVKYVVKPLPGEDFIRVDFDLAQLKTVTKQITRKDGLQLIKHPQDSHIYARQIGSSSKDMGDNLSMLKQRNSDYEAKIASPIYQRSEKDPTCVVEAARFVKTCSSLVTSVKSSIITIQGFQRSIILRAAVENGQNATIHQWGDREDINPEPTEHSQESSQSSYSQTSASDNSQTSTKPMAAYVRKMLGLVTTQRREPDIIKVSPKTIKSLTKLNNLSPLSTIKIYYEAGLPLKLICKIGSYGKLRIYLRSPQE